MHDRTGAPALRRSLPSIDTAMNLRYRPDTHYHGRSDGNSSLLLLHLPVLLHSRILLDLLDGLRTVFSLVRVSTAGDSFDTGSSSSPVPSPLFYLQQIL